MRERVEIGRLALDQVVRAVEDVHRAIRTARLCGRVVTVDYDASKKHIVYTVQRPLPKAVAEVAKGAASVAPTTDG